MGPFRHLLPSLRRHRTALVIGFACAVLTQAAQSLIPPASGAAVDALSGALPDAGLAGMWAGILLLVTGIRGVFQYAMRRAIVTASRDMERELRDSLFSRLLLQGPGWLGRHHTGDLMSRFTADVEAVRWIVGPGAMYIVNTIVIAPLAIAFMWRMSPFLTVLNLTPLIGLAVATRWLAPRLHKHSAAVQETQAALSTGAQESFAGVRVVKSFGREPEELATFTEQADASLDANLKLVGARSFFHPVAATMKGLGLVVTLFVGGRMILDGTLTLGDFLQFHMFGGMLLWPMISLGWVISMWQRSKVSMERLARILEDEPEIAEPDAPLPLPDGPLPVRVAGLSFTYVGTDAPTLHDVSFDVPAGSTVAVVGPTGSGKSTLLALIPRLLPTPAGSVFLAGVSTERLPLAELRSAVGYVPQDAFLFSDTVGENLAFGLPATLPPEERLARVREAARRACVLSEIEGLPQGFDTLLGERGVNLSGGQRQRATIARALALDPRLLLLDDCLSAVDASTESEILANLREVFKGRTTVLVTHRIAAARLADTILVVEDGRITDRGTHDELVEREGFYARLALRQSLEDALEAA